MPITDRTWTEDLWRRVGLEELRQALIRVETSTQRFERALQALPSCTDCARANLLDQVRETSGQLSKELVTLAVLAETLKETAAIAEVVQVDLREHAPTPCRCPSGACSCHPSSGAPR